MDWADDVAYSVHDFEDGVVGGLVDLAGLDVEAVAELAAQEYSEAPAADLATAFRGLLTEPWWPGSFDGTARAQAQLKHCTSMLIGRFCRASEVATRDRFGDEPLFGYAADLVVPERERLECALLKAVTMLYVMRRPEAAGIQQREREVVAEVVAGLAARAPESLTPHYREMWSSAADDSARFRVVVDQVAALTDAAALGVHSRLGP
jgi:dGTPase